jgi:hypothetical protein
VVFVSNFAPGDLPFNAYNRDCHYRESLTVKPADLTMKV